MQCPKCGTEDPNGSIFCLKCGVLLLEPGKTVRIDDNSEHKAVNINGTLYDKEAFFNALPGLVNPNNNTRLLQEVKRIAYQYEGKQIQGRMLVHDGDVHFEPKKFGPKATIHTLPMRGIASAVSASDTLKLTDSQGKEYVYRLSSPKSAVELAALILKQAQIRTEDKEVTP